MREVMQHGSFTTGSQEGSKETEKQEEVTIARLSPGRRSPRAFSIAAAGGHPDPSSARPPGWPTLRLMSFKRFLSITVARPRYW